MNIKDFKWTEKRFGTRFANILKKLGGVSKDGIDGSIEYKDDQGNVTKLVTDSTFSSLLAKNGLIEVKWQELKDKRDNGKLIPGSLYRITDYNCTTTQENTQSAGHQFDIVLLALSANKLAEEGWAMMHPTDIYDVTFADGVTKKCYLYFFDNDLDCNIVLAEDITKGLNIGIGKEDFIELDETNKTAEIGFYYDDGHGGGFINAAEPNVLYNYFQNSNLSAWKVWYCLDNDTARFAWADSGEVVIKTLENGTKFEKRRGSDIIEFNGNTYYQWQEGLTSSNSYTLEERPTINSKIYRKSGPPNRYTMVESLETIVDVKINEPGRGVIYRLIDEWNNDVPYDFKNIQFYNELGGIYIYAIVDETSMEEDPTIDGIRVKAIHLLSNYNNSLSPISSSRLGRQPLINVIFLNNSNVYLDGTNDTIVRDGNNVLT